MTCSRAAPLLHLYVDGRIDPRHLAALEAHLHACAACRENLYLLEATRQVIAEFGLVPEPPNLTQHIMARIAALESRRSVAHSRRFGPRWADALIAALLATITTMLFVLLDPSLRESLPSAFSRSFPEISAFLFGSGPDSIAWIAWIVWVSAGLGLTIWFAGAEVRSSWRRSLSQHLPQLRQLW